MFYCQDTLTNCDAIFFGMWFSYAETLIDDITDAALKVVDQNPLGSAAGYGSSFPIDRTLPPKNWV
jgi:argininosuccinate lyase